MTPSFDDTLRETSVGAYLLFIGSLFYVHLFLVPLLHVGLDWGMQLTIIAYEFLGILGAGLIYRSWADDRMAPAPNLDRLGASIPHLLVPLLAVLVLAIWSNVTVGLGLELFPSFQAMAEQYQKQINQLLLQAEGRERVFGIVAVCVAAPICEEALFRGNIYPEQRKSDSLTWAIWLNGLLFAAFHMNVLTLAPLTVVGALFAQLTEWTRSLWPAVIAHAVFNVFNSLVLPELHDVGVHTEDPAPMQVGPWSLEALGQYATGFVILGVIAGLLWWASGRLLASESDTSEEWP